MVIASKIEVKQRNKPFILTDPLKITNSHTVRVFIYCVFSSDWSRTATHIKSQSVTTPTHSTQLLTSRSSSVISDGTNSSGMFKLFDLQLGRAGPVLHDSDATDGMFGCVFLSQALCLPTAEYPTASTTTSSSMSSTDELWHCKANPDSCSVIGLFVMTAEGQEDRDE